MTTDWSLTTLALLTASAALALACSSTESAPTPIPTATPQALVVPTPAGPSASQIELVVDSLGTDRDRLQSVVILKAKDSDRYLPIWIGPFEANAIAAEVYGVAVPRPQTHDLTGDRDRHAGRDHRPCRCVGPPGRHILRHNGTET